MMKIIFFLGLTLISNNLFAQNNILTGHINNEKGEAVSNIFVDVLNSNLSAISDAKGDFIIKGLKAGRYEISVHGEGYATQYKKLQVPVMEKLVIQVKENFSVLDEVVVRADKRDELLQRVPLSVTSISTNAINDYRLWNINQVTGIVPTFYAADPGDNRNVTSIRGIASTSYDPAVTTYIDGVNQFNLDLYMPELLDVERIEILRGPQSTLYGRNAMGGVINIITKQPHFKTSAFAEANVGNYGLQRYRAGVKTPVTNKLLFGAAFLYNRLDGYYQNKVYNQSYDQQSSFGGNYFLKYLPSSAWSLLLNVKHQQNKNKGSFPLAFGVDAAFKDPYTLSQNAIAQMNDHLLNTSLAVKFNGNNFQLTSETGYQTNYRFYDDKLDADFSPLDAISIFNNYGKNWNKVNAFTQELRISSPAVKHKKSVEWVAGTYLFAQRSPVKQATVFGKYAPLLGVPDSVFRIVNTSTAQNNGIAFFGQLSIPVTNKLTFVGGLRYDYQKSKLSVRSDYARDDATFSFPLQKDTAASTRYNAISPKAGLLYSVNDRQNIYINYSRGFRTGGLTPIGSDPSQPALYPFEPEYSDNFEVGFKNTLFNNHLQLNIAAFYTQVKDIQIPTLILPSAVTITRNGGELLSKGIEAELATTIFKRLSLNYAFGYTDATYKKLQLPVNGTVKSFAGNKQFFTPEVTSMLAVQHKQPVSKKKKVDLITRIEWLYLGTQYFDAANSIRQSPYHLLNARAGVSTKKGEIMLWMRNITKTKYIDFAYDFGGVHLGDPQTFGFTFSVRL